MVFLCIVLVGLLGCSQVEASLQTLSEPNEPVEYGFLKRSIYLPALIDELLIAKYEVPPVAGIEVALAVAEFLGGPFEWEELTKEEIITKVKDGWQDRSVLAEIPESTLQELAGYS